MKRCMTGFAFLLAAPLFAQEVPRNVGLACEEASRHGVTTFKALFSIREDGSVARVWLLQPKNKELGKSKGFQTGLKAIRFEPSKRQHGNIEIGAEIQCGPQTAVKK